MNPRIFISSVSSELASVRQLVANSLTRLGYEPVWQDTFGTESGDLRQVLREKINSCDGLIQLVGHAYGAEPPAVDATFGRVSYTQFEFLYAHSLGKKTWLIFADEGCTRDRPLENLDRPRDPTHPDPDGYQAERRALQEAWRRRWKQEGHLRHGVASDTDLELMVERLKDEFSELRRAFGSWQQKVMRHQVIVALLLVAVGAGVSWIVFWQPVEVKQIVQEAGQKTGKQIVEAVEQLGQELTNPAILADRIRKEINSTAEEKINAIPDEQGRGRKIAEIENERDLALGRVDDLIKLIQEGLKEGASPVFQRAADILQKQGTDAAIEYLESRRPSTLETARRHAEQAKTAQSRADAEKKLRNKNLQPLVLEAQLLETRFQWKSATQLREHVAKFAADWFEARIHLGRSHFIIGNYGAAEPHLREAAKLAAIPGEEAAALNDLSLLLARTNRLTEAEELARRALAIDEQAFGKEHVNIAVRLNNLAQLLQDTNRLAEAEPLMRRALAIDERSFEPAHPNVARNLNNLAMLLRTNNRPSAAEPLMRRALAIDSQYYPVEHHDVARDLNNLAQLLQDTNRLPEAEPLIRRAVASFEKSLGTDHPSVGNALNNLAGLLLATGRLAEAEPLLRRALPICEQSYGSEHIDVVAAVNNLAQLLQATNRLPEAEPLIRRTLAGFETSLGTDHPHVATALNNLATLLMTTNRLAEAEPLLRRALEIDEQSYGAEHPDVARDVINLALLLQATDHLAEADLLMQRCIAILYSISRETGHEHADMPNSLAVYRDVLQDLSVARDEIERRIDEATASRRRFDLRNYVLLKPIGPEVERLLGPTKTVADVLASLDQQYKAEGKPAVYLLPLDQPITPYLDELLKPNPEFLNAAGASAFLQQSAYADAVVLFEESLKHVTNGTENVQTSFTTRIYRDIALRELGAVERARDSMRQLLAELDRNPVAFALTRGFCGYNLALCEWRLGDHQAAHRAAAESLKAYGDATETEAEVAPLKLQTMQLLADLTENRSALPIEKVDWVGNLENARSRFQARADMAALPLNQSALPLLDQILGPAKSTQEVLDALDRQYREEGKPAVWFLPLSEPITPHLDELLGPLVEATQSLETGMPLISNASST